MPAFPLVDERDRRTSLASFRGRYLLLTPSLTLCHEVCPMTTAALLEIQPRLDRDRLGHQASVAEISVDPWRDSPARLRAYRRLAGVHFRMLTGSQSEIRRAWKFFGVRLQARIAGPPGTHRVAPLGWSSRNSVSVRSRLPCTTMAGAPTGHEGSASPNHSGPADGQ